MPFADLDDSDFVDIQPQRSAPKSSALLKLAFCKIGRTGRQADRLQFNFAPELLGEIGGPRFAVAYAEKKQLVRIKAEECGAFEASNTTRGSRMLIRIPVPAGLAVCDLTEAPEYYVDAIGKAILVEMPPAFVRKPPAPTPSRVVAVARPTNVTSSTMGDPTPGRDALTARMEEDNRLIQSMLGVDELLPRKIGGMAFTSNEIAILTVLLKREAVSRLGLMMATREPGPGDDERDDKIIDVFISKMRKRLTALGFDITTIPGKGFRLTADAKARLKAVIAEDQKTGAS